MKKTEFDDVIDDNPLPNYQKWQKYLSFKLDIPETPLYKSKPMISKHYKKETDVKVGQIFYNKEALDLAIRLKALDEGYQFLNKRKLHVLKLAETYRAMVQEWYYKRRKLAGTCQCRKWQLSGLPCGHVIAVTRFTSPPRRSFVGGLVATVDPVELERFSTNQVKRILTYSLGYDENSPTFLYLRKPNCSLDSGLVPLADALQDRNMLLTYAQSHQNRLHVYVSRVEISPLVVADQHKDEGGKKEKHRKPSCSKKLFD
ncbi:transposase, MuDR, MULE transposase domain protein [Tanacetum coccineum]